MGESPRRDFFFDILLENSLLGMEEEAEEKKLLFEIGLLRERNARRKPP